MPFLRKVVDVCQHAYLPLARFALFLVFFWFGILKVFLVSPANPLVQELLSKTMPFVGFDLFITIFGLYEVLIGIVFLFPRLDKLSLILFGVHMITTAGPLVLLPGTAWQMFLVPTLEGQYIIKNIALVALAVSIIASHKYHIAKHS